MDINEKYLTFKQAAGELNIPVYKLRRAAKGDLFPLYYLHNKRAYMLVSEIRKAMERVCPNHTAGHF